MYSTLAQQTARMWREAFTGDPEPEPLHNHHWDCPIPDDNDHEPGECFDD